MVVFELAKNDCEIRVVVNGNTIGFISKERGFYFDPSRMGMSTLPAATSKDLAVVAAKADEACRYGVPVPECRRCGGTPNFPKLIRTPHSLQSCEDSLHPFLPAVSL
jgi:hypothetical protein